MLMQLLTAVVLSEGATETFAATSRVSDGSVGPITVTWRVSGGTMSQSGLFTAGAYAGVYRLIAQAGGLADTSLVTIIAPTRKRSVVIRDVGELLVISCAKYHKACLTLLSEMKRLVTPRRRIGFDPSLLRLTALVLLLASAGLLRPGPMLHQPVALMIGGFLGCSRTSVIRCRWN
jgi:hypothetical protein